LKISRHWNRRSRNSRHASKKKSVRTRTKSGTGTIATCYLITATAADTQVNDTDCTTITYDSAGVKSGTTADCW
jgi:Tfp pilus assembly protein PilE